MCAQQPPPGIVCCVLSGTKQLLREGAGTSVGREGSAAGRQQPSPCTGSFALAEQSSPQGCLFFPLSRQMKMFLPSWKGISPLDYPSLNFFTQYFFSYSLTEPNGPWWHCCPQPQIPPESGKKKGTRSNSSIFIACFCQQPEKEFLSFTRVLS